MNEIDYCFLKFVKKFRNKRRHMQKNMKIRNHILDLLLGKKISLEKNRQMSSVYFDNDKKYYDT